MKVWALIAGLVLAAPNPVAAQDLIYSDQATRSCLGQASDARQQESCAGQSARVCMSATPGGQSTAAMSGCLDRELTFWDGLLNSYYQSALSRARQFDQEQSQYGAVGQTLEDALRAMQRAWIPFRDASCDFARVQWGGGTGGGPATLTCLMEHTARQALVVGRFGAGG
ncbi:MAG: lysozyme inhibitor LprI family protein [Sedimentitalea sp.]